jgi:hypothetical protein
MSGESAGNGSLRGETAGDGARNPIETPEPLEDNGAAPLPNGWKRQCGAKTRNGPPCRRPPLAGRTRCRLHGGASLAGIASPHFKHGRRSRYLRELPGVLKTGYKAALNDPDLLSLKEEVALLTARMIQLLGRLERADGPAYDATWTELRACILEKGKVAAAEWKRLCDLKAVLTVEQVMMFVGAIMGAARELVDPDTFRRLNDRTLQLLPPEPR